MTLQQTETYPYLLSISQTAVHELSLQIAGVFAERGWKWINTPPLATYVPSAQQIEETLWYLVSQIDESGIDDGFTESRTGRLFVRLTGNNSIQLGLEHKYQPDLSVSIARNASGAKP